MCLKLSNSGDALKSLIPSSVWKYISGWSNYSDMVTIQEMIDKEMGYRGSKSALNIVNCGGAAIINNNRLGVVKEQRVDGSYIGASG